MRVFYILHIISRTTKQTKRVLQEKRVTLSRLNLPDHELIDQAHPAKEKVHPVVNGECDWLDEITARPLIGRALPTWEYTESLRKCVEADSFLKLMFVFTGNSFILCIQK